MAYNPNIPQATDQLSQSQSDLLNNFQAINALIDINNGFYFFPVSGTMPSTSATQGAIYCQTGLTSVPALFFRGASNASVPSGGFTEKQQTGTFSNGNGWTRLPSGILLKWGGITNPVNLTPINFPVNSSIPAFTALYNILITPLASSGTMYLNNANTTQFVVQCSAGMSLTYLAIGI